MNVEKISKLIKEKRKEKNLTQENLANKLNVTEKAISRWETGRGTPDISLLLPLSKELGISVSELLNGKENEKENQNISEIVNYIDITKSKKNKYIIPIAAILYGILLILYLWYLKTEYNMGSTLHISYAGEIFFNLFFIVSIFNINRLIANYYFDTIKERHKMDRISCIIILVICLIMFLNLTIFGRRINSFGFNNYNLIPFKTIIKYIVEFAPYNIFVNFIGNIIILMPIEFLLIKIFNLKDIKTNLLVDVFLSLTIEFIQFISHTGVFDIDDIILNVFGMFLMYLFVTKKYDRILVKYKDKISTSIVSLIITLIMFHSLSWYYIGNIPTLSVLLRLIFFFLIIELVIYKLYLFFKNIIKNR